MKRKSGSVSFFVVALLMSAAGGVVAVVRGLQNDPGNFTVCAAAAIVLGFHAVNEWELIRSRPPAPRQPKRQQDPAYRGWGRK